MLRRRAGGARRRACGAPGRAAGAAAGRRAAGGRTAGGAARGRPRRARAAARRAEATRCARGSGSRGGAGGAARDADGREVVEGRRTAEARPELLREVEAAGGRRGDGRRVAGVRDAGARAGVRDADPRCDSLRGASRRGEVARGEVARGDRLRGDAAPAALRPLRTPPTTRRAGGSLAPARSRRGGGAADVRPLAEDLTGRRVVVPRESSRPALPRKRGGARQVAGTGRAAARSDRARTHLRGAAPPGPVVALRLRAGGTAARRRLPRRLAARRGGSRRPAPRRRGRRRAPDAGELPVVAALGAGTRRPVTGYDHPACTPGIVVAVAPHTVARGDHPRCGGAAASALGGPRRGVTAPLDARAGGARCVGAGTARVDGARPGDARRAAPRRATPRRATPRRVALHRSGAIAPGAARPHPAASVEAHLAGATAARAARLDRVERCLRCTTGLADAVDPQHATPYVVGQVLLAGHERRHVRQVGDARRRRTAAAGPGAQHADGVARVAPAVRRQAARVGGQDAARQRVAAVAAAPVAAVVDVAVEVTVAEVARRAHHPVGEQAQSPPTQP